MVRSIIRSEWQEVSKGSDPTVNAQHNRRSQNRLLHMVVVNSPVCNATNNRMVAVSTDQRLIHQKKRLRLGK